MIDPKKLIGFIYDAPLPFEQKSRMAGLALSGNEGARREIFLFLKGIVEKYRAQKTNEEEIEFLEKAFAAMRQKLYRAGEKIIAKIEKGRLGTMENAMGIS